MAYLTENGLRRPAEKFMGTAEQVARPALAGPAPAPVAAPPAPGAANMMGSGSAPIGGTGGAAGAEAAGASRMAGLAGGARTLANGAMGKVIAGGAAVQAIGDSMDKDSTDRYATRFGVDAPTGDGSFGDLAKFAGLRAGGFASDLGNRLTLGLAGNLYRDNPGAAKAAPVSPTAGAAAAMPVAGPGVPAAGAPAPEVLAGTPLFGAEGVRKVAQPSGAPLYTNSATNAGDAAFAGSNGTLSSIGGGAAQMQADQRATDLSSQISLMRAGLRDRGDTNAYLKGAIGTASLQPGGASSELQEQIARITKGGKNLTAAGAQAVNQLLTADQANQTHRAEIAERANTNNRNADITLRGQDITQAGHELTSSTAQRGQDMTARTAANAAKIAQMNADREFGLKGSQFGAQREDADAGQRSKAIGDLTSRYEAQFTTTDKDGKTVVDKARVGRFTNGVQTFLGNKQNELQQKVAAGQATPQEKQALDAITRKGIGALDAEDLATIEAQIKTGERIEQTAGTFIGSGLRKSANPDDYAVVGRKQNLFGSDTLTTKNGSTIRENDLKYDEPGNLLMPNLMKHQTNDFDLAKKGLRK